jgi:hypothetical protein
MWNTEENDEKSAKIIRVTAEIWSGDIPNTIQNRHLLSHIFGYAV